MTVNLGESGNIRPQLRFYRIHLLKIKKLNIETETYFEHEELKQTVDNTQVIKESERRLVCSRAGVGVQSHKVNCYVDCCKLSAIIITITFLIWKWF